MWIVQLALRRPYTFIVMALVILLTGVYALLTTATDIFPTIRIPVVAVVWNYNGLPPQDMADRVVSFSERVATTTVNDIEHVESNSLNGIAVVKYYFQPRVNEDLAVAQITSISQTLLRQMPPGTFPPFILAYNASSVPVLQLALASASLSQAQLFDLGNNFLRPPLSTIAGVSLPWPYGGTQRQVQVDLDPDKLRTLGLSAADVSQAIVNQDQIIPAGTEKIDDLQYFIELNASPVGIDELNRLPIKYAHGALIRLADVAHVRDGFPPQTNIVRMNGHRAVLMSVLKTGSASTLNVVDRIRAMLPQLRKDMPAALQITPLGDQSVFVRAAIHGVVREGVIAALLTAAMILLFLGSWRSTLIIALSIPLSVLASIVCLSLLGETINIMTLGGLALAVGILVDDATVAIENINWHLEQGKPVHDAILDGAHQIAVPALVSTLCICIVFVPMFLLGGVARFLFVPMAEAVIFAMLASYLLSRTLVPTLAQYWLRPHQEEIATTRGWMQRYQLAFEHGFDRLRARYQRALQRALQARRRALTLFTLLMLSSLLLLPSLGSDFFPAVDTGQIKLHLRARTGLRIEQTAALCDEVETAIKKIIPADQIESLVDNIGLPYSGINLSYSTSAPIGPGDADIMISLRPGHAASADYIAALRRQLPSRFPDTEFSFLPADIVSQILNFGLPAPIDLQIAGFKVAADRQYADHLLAALKKVPGLVDLRIQQRYDYPEIKIKVNRDRALSLGLTENDVAQSLLITLSGSMQTQPVFWLDPKTHVQYLLTTQAPEYRMQTLNDLQAMPVTGHAAHSMQLLANLASFERRSGPAVVSHYNVKPVFDIYGSTWQRDLGSVAHDVDAVVRSLPPLPQGSSLSQHGQVLTMHAAFHDLTWGILAAIVLVYLLIVVNFQSWLDPLIIISALPAALAGIIWMLFITGTTMSVPALTGTLMCIGVATANSILVVSFARERLLAGDDAPTAALHAGTTRLRPVLMTALAMIIGMLPMALGLGEGGEQNAPLGRAVIGGLILATIATLSFVPIVFASLHSRSRSAS